MYHFVLHKITAVEIPCLKYYKMLYNMLFLNNLLDK